MNPYDNLPEEEIKDDYDNDYDDFGQVLDDQFLNKKQPHAAKIDTILQNQKFLVEKGDPKMNLWEQGGQYRKTLIQTEDVKLIYGLIEETRLSKMKTYWTEKQLAESSCFMLDFDIFQPNNESLLNERQVLKLQQSIANLIIEKMNISSEVVIFSDVRRKPSTKWEEKHNAWKDGFQMFIHAKFSRDTKRFLVHEILREKICTKAFGKEYSQVGVDPEKFLDTQCCHVPTLLYGSSKSENVAKHLWLVYQWSIDDDKTLLITKDEYFLRSEKINFVLELSCIWEGNIIKKKHFDAKDEFKDTVALMSRKASNTTVEERQTLLDEVQLLLVSDPDAAYIKSILDCLKPQRYNNHTLRFKTIYALVKSHENYIPLARLFFKKSHKYTDAKFDQILKDVSSREYTLNLDTLYYWASKDSPEKFKACNEKSCFMLMSKYVFDPITDGKLGHAHFAEIIHLFLKNKYKTDDRDGKRVWMEFKFPTDQYEKGQVYKWVEVASPDSLNVYLHRKLNVLCEKMVKYLNKKVKDITDKVMDLKAKKLPDSNEKGLQTYYLSVLKNFKASARCLWIDGFKVGIIRQSEAIFNEPGFLKSLDQGQMDIGVGNGILQLSWEGKLPKLIRAYNTCKISRYTDTPYKQFDPTDPLTRKILRALRSVHPDDETDAFEYKMYLKASSIDARAREALGLLVTGPGSNGKSLEFEMHQESMGMLCVSMPIQTLIQTKEDSGESATPFLMQLEVARAAYYEEGPTCAILNMAKFKRITGCANLPGRKLFGNGGVIKTRCYHFILSNHDFIITSHEEATWRRIRYLYQKIIFRDENKIDYKNKYHRLMDRSLNAHFIQEEATKSAYLSIMVFQHMKLMRRYNGVVDRVPHPTIDKQTLEFRNRQDTINRFVTERIVIAPDQDEPTPLENIVDSYCKWFDSNIREMKHYKSDIFKQMQDSGLKDILDTMTYGIFLRKGYKVLDTRETNLKEILFHKKTPDVVMSEENPFPEETPDEYLLRVEREWAEMMADEKSQNIDLSDTYTYESDDEDCEDDLLVQDDIKYNPVEDTDVQENAFDESVIQTMADYLI